MCFGGGGFMGLGDAPAPPQAPPMPPMPAPPGMPGSPGGGATALMNYPQIAQQIQSAFPAPQMNSSRPGGTTIGGASLGGANVSGANIMPYQQGLTPQTIQQGLGMINNVYNTAGKMGNQFMTNAANAGNEHYNPAISAFNNATNSNMMNVASMLASQRGTGVNPGLAARNIGVMGANTQQQAVNQLGSLVGQYAMGQQQNAMGAYGLQGQMGNAYSQAGLQNQGQILNALAQQNAANVAMQSNINSNNVAMQSNINSNAVAMQSNINASNVNMQGNINNNNTAMDSNLNNNATQQYLGQMGSSNSMYNAGLGYNANIYGSQLGYQGGVYGAQLGYLNNNNRLNQQGSGGFWSGVGSALPLIPFLLNKGGQVPRGYARGGEVKKMSAGGESDGEFNGQGAGDQSDSFTGNSFSVSPTGGASMPSFNTDGPQSMMGRMLQAMNQVDGEGQGQKQPYEGLGSSLTKGVGQMLGMGKDPGGFGESAGIPDLAMPEMGSQFAGSAPTLGIDAAAGLARGGAVPPRHVVVHHMHHYGQGGNIQPDQQQMPGPMMPNLGLAGSPNQRIAAPPTGMPMGNAQTRGGGPMPGIGRSGGWAMSRGGPVRRMAQGGQAGQFPGQANGGQFPGQGNGGTFPGQGWGVGGTPPGQGQQGDPSQGNQGGNQQPDNSPPMSQPPGMPSVLDSMQGVPQMPQGMPSGAPGPGGFSAFPGQANGGQFPGAPQNFPMPFPGQGMPQMGGPRWTPPSSNWTGFFRGGPVRRR